MEIRDQATSATAITIGHPDLLPAIASVPAAATSGDTIGIDWTVTNGGSAPAPGNWVDRVYLSADGVLSSDDLLLGELPHQGPLAPQASYQGHLPVVLPDVSGPLHVLVVTDALNTVQELGGEANNTAAAPIQVAQAPYADLAVTQVGASPDPAIGDPAKVTVTWTVRNIGTGPGRTGTWVDSVVASRDDVFGNGDDLVLGQFTHTGALAVNDAYNQSQTILLPPR